MSDEVLPPQLQDPISKLDEVSFRNELAESISIDLDDAAVILYQDGHRNHLGMSEIGSLCARQLWYKFRWVKTQRWPAHMLRLFNRGNLEEFRIIEWLREIGCTVDEIDPATNKQFRVSDIHGHLGGSIDAIITLPPRYGVKEPLIGEFKTWKQSSEWTAMLKKGLIAGPGPAQKHYIQMSMYGYKLSMQWGLYIAVNKNNDNIFLEIVKLNFNIAEEMLRKSEEIINANVIKPPPKISQSEAHFVCKWCNFTDVCHQGAPVEKNCRSCQHSRPVADAKWQCDLHNSIIPEDFIAQGCDNFLGIKE